MKCFLIKKMISGEYFLEVLLGAKNKSEYIYTLAEAHAIDLIAKTIAKCEIQVFALNRETKKIEESKNDLYWTLNIQPNLYESGTKFIYKLVTKLLSEKKALVIINQDYKNDLLLYVADDFDMNDSILYGKIFTNIKIADDDGNIIPLRKKYNSENAMYFSIKNTKLDLASSSFKDNMSKLVNSAVKGFLKTNNPKWRLKFPGTQPKIFDEKTKKPVSYDDYKQKMTEGLIGDDEAIVLLSDAFDITNLNKDNFDSKAVSSLESIIKQVGDTVSRDWNIPLDIFYGSKTEKSTGTNDFITFGVDPHFKILEDGFNLGLVGKRDFLKGEYISFNKFNICHKDILESANGIDKLTADGFSRNEINKLLGLPRIDEPWADEHNLTKNYGKVKGGVKEDG